VIEGSVLELADTFAVKTKALLQSARTEEELRIGFEKLLEPILKTVGVPTEPRYERLGAEARTVYHGRPDAVHGQAVIEYEHPHAFSSSRAVLGAHNQLVEYIAAYGARADLNRIIGIGFDGDFIFFVRYRGSLGTRIDRGAFVRDGPYPFDQESARTLLTYLRALARLPLTAENLATRFGPKGEIAPAVVSAFADALEHWGDGRVKVFFEEWKRLFGIVYGERFNDRRKGEGTALSHVYKVGRETDFQELLFCVHTYFALLMKLITAELLTLRETALGSSFSIQLAHSPKQKLKEALSDIEAGGIYTKQGITNFLEGDFFRWYLDAFSPRLEEAIREMARALSDFEPATTSVDPESSRDLLKKLYQYLVPQEVRHNLGEYYTPDWLAELLLNEVGYVGDTRKRLLDPACGSGTFLVLAIHRAKEYGRKHREPPLETVKRIKDNIWGFDLNPLAVIAARTNYVFALGDLIRELPSLEIPIYLADSVLWPERSGQTMLNFAGGEYVKVQTSVYDFHVPSIWIKDRGFLMTKAAPLVEEMARHGYTVLEATNRLKKQGLLFPPHEQVIINFYKEILELEKQGKNGIGARFLKNVFAPMVAGQFDFVVGNPPWIRWGYLSQEYRDATLTMWKTYGLFPRTQDFASRSLGAGEKDFSMLFTYATADYYLKKGGKLGFLITQEVFKSKGAGEGFRRFQIADGAFLKVVKAHDLVSVQPFEGAANKTGAVVLKKGAKTRYPVPYTVWTRRKGIGKIPTDLAFSSALPLLRKTKLLAQPIGSPTGSWQTITKSQERLSRVQGHNPYQARRGASTEPYGVFWLEVKQVLSNGDLIVRNLPEKGKRKIRQIQERIESALVFPAVPGSDIERWSATPTIFVLITHPIKSNKPYTESDLRQQHPRSYGYLTNFKEILLSRGSKVLKKLAERTSFFTMFGIGEYTFARYKVVWKRMASDLVAAVIAQHKTPFGYKTIIPTDTTSLFHTENESEAHYLCAVINSTPVREFIKSYSSAGRGFGAPSVMSHVGIPKFDPKEELHKKLAEISRTLHELKAQNDLGDVDKLEKQNDELVGKLFGLEENEDK